VTDVNRRAQPSSQNVRDFQNGEGFQEMAPPR
jgi:hypothetical protein